MAIPSSSNKSFLCHSGNLSNNIAIHHNTNGVETITEKYDNNKDINLICGSVLGIRTHMIHVWLQKVISFLVGSGYLLHMAEKRTWATSIRTTSIIYLTNVNEKISASYWMSRTESMEFNVFCVHTMVISHQHHQNELKAKRKHTKNS